ncbi:S-layer homology domain-containing protein [Sporosarcina sp. ACRSM]|uniref:S-layer homology domain-containing protein n=1 Tax=Sporosarcina sp. ACRSM TaxID=2918216 RepID=UPI001EF6AB0E|nr:S-layer homology domain-containing protein [Sporosarcina sp. ACRSM]
MRKKVFTVLGTLLLAGSLPLSGTFAASTERFSDVPSSKHYAEAVYDLAERNIIGGYPDGTFKPGNSITRGQAAAIIAKMTNMDTSNVKNPGFKDVSTANGYYKAIAALAEKGVIGGYEDGRFGPNDPIKRGQMASILVKAFDLPRDGNIINPFKDIEYLQSHRGNILIIYQLGITSGTSPDTFSPNAAITRGQAAKMLKATEESKPTMITLRASEFNWRLISEVVYDESNDGLFKSIQVAGKEGYTEDQVQLVPLKEGTGKLNIAGLPSNGSYEMEYKKYYVTIKKVNGELKLTMEETDDILPTAVKFHFLKEKVQYISLSTMQGEKLSDSVTFKQEESRNGFNVWFDIDKPGQYIATLRFEGGKEERHGIDVKLNDDRFYYEIKTLKENPSDVYEETATADLGKHIIRTKDAEQIAIITRDPGTNLFRVKATGQKEGTISIDYDRRLSERYCDYIEPECYSAWTGLYVQVQRIGSIVNVDIRKDYEMDH